VPNLEDLTDEMFTILTAAADTSGHAMAIITYYVVTNPDIYRTLTAELNAAFPDRPSNLEYLSLEKLPYLTAVVKEGLRFSYGVPGRLPRMIETLEATFNGYTVPRGTIVGMSSWMMHRDSSIWPEPERFVPERWLNSAKAKNLDKYLVSFTKGSRQCIGMQYVPVFFLFTRVTQFR
jgi:cytochrome P450